ncbi:MAG: ferritin-like domain-containing protein [Sporichthyaceae bacterium]
MIRRQKSTWQLHGSEAELIAMTRDLDDAHREAMVHMEAEAKTFGQNLMDLGAHRLGRRKFLAGVGVIGGATVLAACGDDDEDEATSPPDDAPPAAGGDAKYEGDLAIVAFAAALENQAVVAYDAALMAAGAGALGEVPAAVGAFATTAKAQHVEHALAWNKVLRTVGLPEITGVPLKNHQSVLDALGKVKDVGEVAKLALTLEDQAASTYLLAMGAVTDAGGIAAAATIAPVESMHSAILRYVLGMYPVPDTLISTKGAEDPANFTGKPA